MNRFASFFFLALATSIGAGAAPTADWSGLPVVDDACTGPQWPKQSLERGPQAVLAIAVLVAADGSPLRYETLSSSGDPLLDSTALAYLSGCRFRPALAAGRPVERWMAIHYVWNIESGALPQNQKLVRAAAGRGDAAAQYALGFVLAHGKSPIETAEGRRWLLSAADQGHAMAQHQLGDLYSLGLGVPADLQQARAWYARAAALGNWPARDRLRDLGGAPQADIATRREPTVAPATCPKPVYPRESLRVDHQGVVTVAFLIGVDGSVRDTRILSSSGHPALDSSAAAALASCRFKPARTGGQAVELWQPVQYVWALSGANSVSVEQYVRRAADQGSLDAKYALSRLRGEKTPEANAERQRLLRAAAEEGHSMAQYSMAETYMRGLGVAVDRKQALDWYQKSAAQGNVLAVQRLKMLAAQSERGAPAP